MRRAPSFALLVSVSMTLSLGSTLTAGCATSSDIADDDPPVLGDDDAASPARDGGKKPEPDAAAIVDAAGEPDAAAILDAATESDAAALLDAASESDAAAILDAADAADAADASTDSDAAVPVVALSALTPAALDVLGAVAGRTASERTGLVEVELDAPAPAGGRLILLDSEDNLSVVVPAEITIPEGHTRGSFRVRADSAVEALVVIYATDGDNDRTMTVHVVTSAPAPSLLTKELVLNEIVYSPPSSGDSDCSGKRNTTADEFVEIVNISAHPVDLLDVSVHDATTASGSPRYKFVSRVLGAGEAVLVYGKSEISGTTVAPPPVWCTTPIASSPSSIGDAPLFRAATSLELGNNGDTVFLTMANKASVLDKWTYAKGAAEDSSLERTPQIGVATAFTLHTEAAGAAADRVMTPGTLADGTPFALATP